MNQQFLFGIEWQLSGIDGKVRMDRSWPNDRLPI
jgi:hypothetical protein